MAEVLKFPDGGYRFIRGVFPYSAGVAAEPGFEIHRVSFADPVPLDQGFRRIQDHLASLGRPLAALCACELRSPAPFTEAGFAEFNRGYVDRLKLWGIFRDGVNPVARSNVCPESQPPPAPGFRAFSYTTRGARGGFVVAGNGEAPEGMANYRDHIVRRGDLSPDAMKEKVRWVLGEQQQRLKALGAHWGDVTEAQVYTVHPVFTLAHTELVQRAVMGDSIVWHRCRPPVVDIEFEMDCRGVAGESGG